MRLKGASASKVSETRGLQSKLRVVNKTSISEEIAQQIMDLIASGDLKPGQRLPSERDLCKTFGAGRSSVREALRCLSIVGVLNARVGEGTSLALDGRRFLGKVIEWRLITQKYDVENLLEVRIDLVSMIRSQLERGLSQVLLLPNAIPLSCKEHVAIFDAIRRRKPEVAREAMHANLQAALHRYRVTGDNVIPARRKLKSSSQKI